MNVFLEYYLVFPCVFALCTHKNTETYSVIIDELKSAAQRMNQQFTPSLIMSDFESGFIKAVKKAVSSFYFIDTQFIFYRLFSIQKITRDM